MKKSVTLFLASVLFLVLGSSARADVLVVAGFGTSPNVGEAVAAATDGDTILIAAGAYPEQIVIDGKSLTLVADGGPVRVHSLVVRNLAANQRVLLRGVGAVRPPGAINAGVGLLVQDCLGDVRAENATFEGGIGDNDLPFSPGQNPDGWSGVSAFDSAAVTLTRCVITGGIGSDLTNEDFEFGAGDGGDAVRAAGSLVTVSTCQLTGGRGGFVFDTIETDGGAGGHGVRATTGTVFVSGCNLVGGDGGFSGCDPFAGCGDGGPGGSGIRVGALSGDPAQAFAQDNGYAPGSGGSGGPGSQAPDGQPIFEDTTGSSTTFGETARRLRADTPIREGQQVTLAYGGLAGDAVAVIASPAPDAAPLTALSGVLLVDRSAAGNLTLLLGTADGSGAINASFLVPELGLDAITLHLQAVTDGGSGLVLGTTTAVVLLDGGL